MELHVRPAQGRRGKPFRSHETSQGQRLAGISLMVVYNCFACVVHQFGISLEARKRRRTEKCRCSLDLPTNE
eukprot:46094-Eustigmatos_ZCMA.PRE.1